MAFILACFAQGAGVTLTGSRKSVGKSLGGIPENLAPMLNMTEPKARGRVLSVLLKTCAAKRSLGGKIAAQQGDLNDGIYTLRARVKAGAQAGSQMQR